MAAVTDIPYKFVEVWGKGAAGGFVTDPIPDTVVGAAASQHLGFPPATATPVGAGGTPPNVADMNGLGFYVTSWAQWQQLGGPVFYDAALSTAVNGYPKGAVLAQSTLPGAALAAWWVNGVDNNTSNPDTGGGNWVDPFARLISGSGYQKLPSGIIIQWTNQALTVGATTAVNFPIAFPNAGLTVIGSLEAAIPTGSNSVGLGCEVISTTQFHATLAGTAVGSYGCSFIAIGY